MVNSDGQGWNDPTAGNQAAEVITAVMGGNAHSPTVDETIARVLGEADASELVRHLAGLGAALLAVLSANVQRDPQELLQEFLLSMHPDRPADPGGTGM